MLRLWQKIALFVLAIAIVSFAASFFFPAEYKICGPNEYTHAKECAEHYLGPFISLWIIGVLDTHNGLVTAAATVFVAGFTWTLWLTSREQGRLTRQSIELGRKEFISTHRPKIVVFDFQFFGEHNKPQKIAFRFSNAGATKALVTGTAIELLKEDRNTPPGGVDLKLRTVNPPVEVPSGHVGLRISDDSFGAGDEYFASFRDAGTLFCVGYVAYTDEIGTSRRTGFCRRFDTESHRWLRVEDDDYEYSY
jgi:hypothetical protein